MKRKGPLTPDSFRILLLWLDPELDKAGDKYKLIHLKLVKILSRRGCHVPEELADEIMDRVGLKVPEIAESYSGDKHLYFYGVAKKVFLEYLDSPIWENLDNPDRNLVQQPLPELIEREQQDRRHECLEECLAMLSEQDREFILQYFQDDKKDRINNRRKMAESLGVSIEALRMRAHRIKALLKKCVHNCVGKRPRPLLRIH